MVAIATPHRHETRRKALAVAVASALGTAVLLGSGAAHAEPLAFKAPGSETTVTIGGYIKLDAIWSSRSAGVGSVGDQELNPSLIPVGPTAGEHKKGQVTLHARQTRLSLGTSTPTSYGPLTTYIEGDFFGAAGDETASNSNGFRIRHAVGTLGHLTAGQTWTNVFNEQAYPELVDFGGNVGEIFVRQAQVRWTDKFASGEWSVSAENPESLLAVPGKATLFRSDSDHVPDLTGRVKFSSGGGVYTAGVLLRQIHVDSAAAPAANAGKLGGALAFSGIVPVGAQDDLRLDLNVGNAIGRYQVVGFLPDGYVDANGNLRLATQASGYAAYRHVWTTGLRSTLALAAATSSPPSDTAAGVNKSDRSLHANLIWSPVAAVNLGVEFIHARREVVGGDHGSLNRIQLAAQYSF